MHIPNIEVDPLASAGEAGLPRAEIPSGTVAAGSGCDVSRSFAAVDDEDMDDIAIAADFGAHAETLIKQNHLEAMKLPSLDLTPALMMDIMLGYQ